MTVISGAVRVNIGGKVYEYNRMHIAFYIPRPLGIDACVFIRRTMGHIVYYQYGDCIRRDQSGHIGIDVPFKAGFYAASYSIPSGLSLLGEYDLVNSSLQLRHPYYYLVMDRFKPSQRIELMVYDSRYGVWITVAYARGPTVLQFKNDGESAVKIGVYPHYSSYQKVRVLYSDVPVIETATVCLSPVNSYACIPGTVSRVQLFDADLTGISL